MIFCTRCTAVRVLFGFPPRPCGDSTPSHFTACACWGKESGGLHSIPRNLMELFRGLAKLQRQSQDPNVWPKSPSGTSVASLKAGTVAARSSARESQHRRPFAAFESSVRQRIPLVYPLALASRSLSSRWVVPRSHPLRRRLGKLDAAVCDLDH